MSTPTCPTCEEKVFFNEQYRVLGRVYHKRCFRCVSCNKVIELGKHLENGRQPYCQSCYAKNHGPRGYGFGQGAGIMSGNYDGTTPAPTPASVFKRRSKKNVTPPENDFELEDEVKYEEEKRASLVSEDFDEPDEEPVASFEEEEEKEEKRKSKRKSKRRSRRESKRQAAASPLEEWIEKIKEMCGCGRTTVKE